jgi:hypothetical protein
LFSLICSFNGEKNTFFGAPYLITMLLSNDFEALNEWDSGGL